MPKFYRQNKKRIDPRYFLNETTYTDQLEENLMNPEQRSFNLRTGSVFFRLQKLLSNPRFSQYTTELESLMDKVSATIAKRDNGLSDDEFTEIEKAARAEGLSAFADKVLAMLSRSHSGIDGDGDGALDSEELRNLAQDLESTGRK